MLIDTMVAGNSLLTWGTALLIATVSYTVLLLARRVVIARMGSFAKRTTTRVDDLIANVLSHTRTFFLVAVSLAIASTTLAIGSEWAARLRALLVVLFFLQIGLWGSGAARYLLDNYRNDNVESDPGAASLVGALQFVVLLVLWAIIALLALDNLGVDVTALVAGLGVGGIAIALAVQNILGDLFASLAIILDRPFVIGDFVKVDDKVGTVEYIGLKTTRVRAISGEQLVFSNADLLGARIQNFGRMYERRIVFTLGVTYSTSRELLTRIPELIRAAIEVDDAVRFDRSHFSAYGAFSIDFESVYYVKTAAFGHYMDAQQRIYLRIHEAFEANGIDFAFPTQTLHLERAASAEQQSRTEVE